MLWRLLLQTPETQRIVISDPFRFSSYTPRTTRRNTVSTMTVDFHLLYQC